MFSLADYFGDTLQLVFATLIIVLGVCVVVQGFRKLFAKNCDSEETEEIIKAE